MLPKIKTSFWLMTLAVFTFLSACTNKQQDNNSAIKEKQSTYDKALETKTIRVGYIPYTTSFIKDPNTGNLSGIMHDVLMEAGRRMEIKIDFVEELDWSSMITAIQSNKVDLVCTGLWPNSTRGKLVDFTTPIYYSPIKAYVRSGNTKFDGNLKAISSKEVKIAVMDGEMASIIARFDFPDATTSMAPQNVAISQLLLDVASNKADITFVEPMVANEYMANNPNKIKEVSNIAPLRVFPNVMMIPKGDVRFQSMLNTAFEEMVNTGLVSKIVDEYEKYPNSFYKRQLPYVVK